MKLFVEVAHLLWPSMVLAGLWLVVSLVALWYARSTRRPIFLFSGIGAFLLMIGEVLSPARLAYHYLKGIPIPGGTVGRIELLVGAYKYEIAVAAIGALFFLAGLVREVMLARRRARMNAVRAAQAASAGSGLASAGGAPLGGAGIGSGGVAAPASLTREGPEKVGFSSGRTSQGIGRQAPLVSSAPRERQPLPTLSASGAAQPCPRCQAPLSVEAQFCGNCGMPLVPDGLFSFSDEPPTSPQGRASARLGGLRSNEEFL